MRNNFRKQSLGVSLYILSEFHGVAIDIVNTHCADRYQAHIVKINYIHLIFLQYWK